MEAHITISQTWAHLIQHFETLYNKNNDQLEGVQVQVNENMFTSDLRKEDV